MQNTVFLNSGGISDRLRSIGRPYYKFSQIFTINATFQYVLQLNNRIIFEQGADDTNSNMNNAGYTSTTAAGGLAALALAPSVDMTSGFKGGCFSDKYFSMLLGMGFFLAAPPRYIAANAAWSVATCPYIDPVGALLGTNMGQYSVVEEQITQQLVAASFRSMVMELLPVGTASGCNQFLGIPQLTAAGTGWKNSTLPHIGDAMPVARYTFGQDVVLPPSTGDSNYQGNRVLLAQRASGPVWVGVNPNFGVRPAAGFVALDFIAVADVAYMTATVDKDTQTIVPGTLQPLDDGSGIEAKKIADARGRV